MKKITLLLMMTLAFVNMAKADVEWTIWEGEMNASASEGDNSLYLKSNNFANLSVGDVIYFTLTLNDNASQAHVVLKYQNTLVVGETTTWPEVDLTSIDTYGNCSYQITSDNLRYFQGYYDGEYTSVKFINLVIKGYDYTLTKVSIKKHFSAIKTTLSENSVQLGDWANQYEVDASKLSNVQAGDFFYVPATKQLTKGDESAVDWWQAQFYYDWNNLYNVNSVDHDIWAEIQEADISNITSNPFRLKGQYYNCSGVYLYHPVSSFSIGSLGYATFSADQQVTAPASVTAYKGTRSGDKLVLTQFTDNVIPANQGAIIKGDEGAVLEFVASSTETSETSDIQPCTEAEGKTIPSDDGYDYYVLYPGTAASETVLSLSTLLGNWGSWHGNIATWNSGTKTIAYNATKSTLYNTSTVMGDWTKIDENTLTSSLFSSIEAGDKIVVTASTSNGGQVWVTKMTGDSWTETHLINEVSISTKVSYTLKTEDIDVIKERGIRVSGKNFTLAAIKIERASGDTEGGWVNKDWSDYDYLQLNFSSNTLNADATFYVAYYEHDGSTTEATLSEGSTSVRIPLDATYKNCNGNFSMYSHATSGSLTFKSAALIDNDGTKVAEFRKATSGSTLAANKAYLAIPTGEGARALSIVFDDEQETTAIESVAPKVVRTDNVYYNLRGQRVAQPTRGLYIVNGKKVVIK